MYIRPVSLTEAMLERVGLNSEELTGTEKDYIQACFSVLRHIYPKNEIVIRFYPSYKETTPGPLALAVLRNFEFEQFKSGYWSVRSKSQEGGLPSIVRGVALPRAPRSMEINQDTIRGKIVTQLQKRAPLALSVAKDYRRKRSIAWPPSFEGPKNLDLDRPRFNPAQPVLVGMHWFEPGGAESWALTSAGVWKSLGHSVIVAASNPTRLDLWPQLSEVAEFIAPLANVLFVSEMDQWVRLLLEEELALIHVHHDWHLYECLPEIRVITPGTRVVDTTHIIEQGNGGFVGLSNRFTDFIDLHHVISPELFSHYQDPTRTSSAEKVKLGYLASPHEEEVSDGSVAPFSSEVPPSKVMKRLSVGFIGRLVDQKRPYLYFNLIRRLSKKYGQKYELKYVIQGSGPHSAFVRFWMRGSNPESIVRREWGSTSEFLSMIDLLVMPSANEGLALVALEAVAAGVPVLSTDVGSQIAICTPDGVLPSASNTFLRHATLRIGHFLENPSSLNDLLRNQRAALLKIQNQQSGIEVLVDWYSTEMGRP